MSVPAPQLPIKAFKNPDTVKTSFRPRAGNFQYVAQAWPSSLSFLETPRGSDFNNGMALAPTQVEYR